MSLPRASINRKILSEIDGQIEDEMVRDLAKILLQFELENWRIEKLHYADFFDKQITLQCRKRMRQT